MAARAAARRADHIDWTDVTKQQFSTRLRKIMDEKGLSSNEIADRMREHLSEGESFATSNLSHYRQGRSVPRPKYLAALSAALGVNASDLLPGGVQGLTEDGVPSKPVAPRSRRGGGARRRGAASVPAAPRTELAAEVDHGASMIFMEDKGNMVHLKFDQLVSWDVALTILNALKPAEASR
jgi:transcriptional regulator with XRE-family HTH domain